MKGLQETINSFKIKQTVVGASIKVKDWVNHFVVLLDSPVISASIFWAEAFIENKLLDSDITFVEIKHVFSKAKSNKVLGQDRGPYKIF